MWRKVWFLWPPLFCINHGASFFTQKSLVISPTPSHFCRKRLHLKSAMILIFLTMNVVKLSHSDGGWGFLGVHRRAVFILLPQLTILPTNSEFPCSGILSLFYNLRDFFFRLMLSFFNSCSYISRLSPFIKNFPDS